MSDYKNYKDQKIRVKATGEEGEAFESALGFISVFIEEERRPRVYKMDEVELYD